VDVSEQSRGIVVELDEEEMTATLVREYTHPDKVLAVTQANMQVLENGNVFVGGVASRSSPSSAATASCSLARTCLPSPRPNVESYRAFRFPWSGQPQKKPDLVAEPGPEGEVTVYASWNGATEVAEWQVLAGPSRGQLRPIVSAPRDGFETAIAVRTTEPFIGVVAKDRSGRAVGTAKAVEP
jgi:hypothetical protein